MGIVGVIITGIVLFISLVNMVLAYICLVMASPVKKIAAMTVPRTKIPADWDRIMKETTIERRTKRK